MRLAESERHGIGAEIFSKSQSEDFPMKGMWERVETTKKGEEAMGTWQRSLGSGVRATSTTRGALDRRPSKGMAQGHDPTIRRTRGYHDVSHGRR